MKEMLGLLDVKVYDVENIGTIIIGRRGENMARTLAVDVTEYLTKWPDASIELVVRRDLASGVYIADTYVEDNVLYWDITDGDTFRHGYCEIELHAKYGTAIAKSAIGLLHVDASLTDNLIGQPDPQLPWIERVEQAGMDAKAAAEDAAEAAESAEASASNARESAEQAQQAAEDIGESVEAAAESARHAEEEAEAARAEADRAQEAADSIDGKIAHKMEKHLLSFDGTHIYDGNEMLTFAKLKSILLDEPDFAVLVYNDRAYHPNTVSNEQIILIASNVSNGYETMDRLTMLPSGAVTVTTGRAEMVANKVAQISDADKDSTVKYTSNKAVTDVIAPIQQAIEEQTQAIAGKLTKPASGIEVGKYFRVASIDTEGNPVLEAVDLPLVTSSNVGVCRTNANSGTSYTANGTVTTVRATDAEIDAKSQNYKPIVPSNLDYALRAGLISNSQITDADYPEIHRTLGIVTLTQEEYNLLTPNENTIYLIVG